MAEQHIEKPRHEDSVNKKIDPNWYWGLGYRHDNGNKVHGDHELISCRFNNANRCHN
ncbi:MAG: hypothetical protein Q4D06_03285 [Coriobacteriia bacterium]|nr:hypothetical protein [Coriobacteriia bacterium]